MGVGCSAGEKSAMAVVKVGFLNVYSTVSTGTKIS